MNMWKTKSTIHRLYEKYLYFNTSWKWEREKDMEITHAERLVLFRDGLVHNSCPVFLKLKRVSLSHHIYLGLSKYYRQMSFIQHSSSHCLPC